MSKGGDIALACSALFPNKIGLTITTCCQINAPVFTDLTYGSIRYKNTGGQPERMVKLGKKGPDGAYRLKWGLCESVHFNGQPLHYFNSDGEPELALDVVHQIGKTGIPFQKAHKLFHFQSTADPIMAPKKRHAELYDAVLYRRVHTSVQNLPH